MKLFILKRINPKGASFTNNCIVRAESESKARSTAVNSDEYAYGCMDWLFEELTSCEELSPDGERGLILSDYCGD